MARGRVSPHPLRGVDGDDVPEPNSSEDSEDEVKAHDLPLSRGKADVNVIAVLLRLGARQRHLCLTLIFVSDKTQTHVLPRYTATAHIDDEYWRSSMQFEHSQHLQPICKGCTMQ